MNFDPSITIEGAATALGVLGAATGYLISLLKRWRDDRDWRWRTGARLLLLDLLEKKSVYGASEDELWEQYASDSMSQRRSFYKAMPSGRLNRLQFERELRQLQLDHLIDLAGPDHYCIRMNPPSRHEFDASWTATTARTIANKVSADKLREAALRALTKATSSWQREQAMKLLLRSGDPRSVDMVVQQLDSADHDTALSAAEILATFIPGVPDRTPT